MRDGTGPNHEDSASPSHGLPRPSDAIDPGNGRHGSQRPVVRDRIVAGAAILVGPLAKGRIDRLDHRPPCNSISGEGRAAGGQDAENLLVF